MLINLIHLCLRGVLKTGLPEILSQVQHIAGNLSKLNLLKVSLQDYPSPALNHGLQITCWRLTEISENFRKNAPGEQCFYQMETHLFKNFFEVRFYFSSKKGHYITNQSERLTCFSSPVFKKTRYMYLCIYNFFGREQNYSFSILNCSFSIFLDCFKQT